MIVVAGPPGGGKSTLYPLSDFGCAFFNADDRAAALNGGSFIAIPVQVRHAVNREFEAFVLKSIEQRTTFAMETTLRSDITFAQARMAQQAGFEVEMRYLALRNFEMHSERVKARADAGGHSASEATLRGIYDASLRNLRRAVQEWNLVRVYDNTALDASHRLVLETHGGEIQFLADDPPDWLMKALEMS
jgi:predicted ABC-type ATPase